MLYEWLKIMHVISAAVLFATGIGTAFYMLYANFQKDIQLIAEVTRQVVIADALFTGISGIIQPATGFAMVYLKGYSLLSLWLLGSIIGYGVAGACWLPVVYLQIRCRDLAFTALNTRTPLPPLYYRYFKSWCLLGIPAFLALTVTFFLMTNRPG